MSAQPIAAHTSDRALATNGSQSRLVFEGEIETSVRYHRCAHVARTARGILVMLNLRKPRIRDSPSEPRIRAVFLACPCDGRSGNPSALFGADLVRSLGVGTSKCWSLSIRCCSSCALLLQQMQHPGLDSLSSISASGQICNMAQATPSSPKCAPENALERCCDNVIAHNTVDNAIPQQRQTNETRSSLSGSLCIALVFRTTTTTMSMELCRKSNRAFTMRPGTWLPLAHATGDANMDPDRMAAG
mmetsp:Transcript_42967/g.96714  ORF Transcript_42967/g.96714 Transcript_42967/m.96714 type:complete len:245 (+) Transcript_42967:2886-3620(+)